ncbi:uncharacterized protein [Nothobranchius furzeri]|uniref:uncharacterized protein n=1 Tax=Nothobranchius furzeri TaxID=105023 RepID=UPI002403C34D|nr:uncharacterized protein LOC129164990 [Nothobranchius furzeri]
MDTWSRISLRQTEEYEEEKYYARQYLEDSQFESEREGTKRKVKNNKRYQVPMMNTVHVPLRERGLLWQGGCCCQLNHPVEMVSTRPTSAGVTD